MSAFALILVFKIGFGATAITVDMPSKETCVTAAEEAKQASAIQLAWCIDRSKK